MNVLAVKDARKSFGAVEALRGASLELGQGELLGLLGPNGAGKTTLVRALAGRLRLDSGAIELMGRPLANAGGREPLGVVPQEIALYPLLTARENVELPHRVARRDPAAATAAAARWLGLLGLADRADHRTDELSGGEQQRVALARALACDADLLLVDEPTAELDEENRARVAGLLRGAADRGAGVVVATHDPDMVALCDRVVGLSDGRPVPPARTPRR